MTHPPLSSALDLLALEGFGEASAGPPPTAEANPGELGCPSCLFWAFFMSWS